MKTDQRQRLLMILAAGAVALFVADRLVFEPLAGVWAQHSARITQLRKQVDEGTLLLQREATLRARWRKMKSNTLSSDTSMAERRLLNAINDWAQESHATITTIAPQWKHDADDHITLMCRVDASGDLDTLVRLLYDIESSPLGIRPQSVELTAADANGQEINMGVFLSGLVLMPAGKSP